MSGYTALNSLSDIGKYFCQIWELSSFEGIHAELSHQCAAYKDVWKKKGKLQSRSTLLEKIKSSGQAETKSILSAPMLEALGKKH